MANLFFYGTFRKYIVSMLNSHKNIKIQKVVDNVLYENSVPITWGSMERLNYHTDEAYVENGKGFQSHLPRMGLTLDGFTYDSNRKVARLAKEYMHITNDISAPQYPPVPYTFEFTLHIMTKTLEDYFQIIEQIIPYYNPSRNMNIKEIPFQEDTVSTKVEISSISFDPDIDYDENGQQRLVNGSISYTLYGNVYMPIKHQDPAIIHQVFTEFYSDTKSDMDTLEEFVTQPDIFDEEQYTKISTENIKTIDDFS